MARINLKNVVVDFPIVNASSHSLQLRLFQSLGGKLISHHKTVVVRALDGVDLTLGGRRSPRYYWPQWIG